MERVVLPTTPPPAEDPTVSPGIATPRASLPVDASVIILTAIGLFLAIVAVLVFLVTRDDGHRRYPDTVRLNFSTACVRAGGTVDACVCALEEFEDRYTLDEYIAMENTMAVTGRTPSAASAIMLECL
jgi:hypothetical protein